MPEPAVSIPLSPPVVLDRVPARPGVVLAGHLVYTLLSALLFANTTWLIPLLVRLRFGSADPYWKDWQTTLVTAAVPICMMLSIFWNALLRRSTLRTYLLVWWLVAVLPLGCLALVQNYWQLLACHVLAAAGLGGTSPLGGKLLQHFYSVATRGRIYALLNVATLGGECDFVSRFFAPLVGVPEDPVTGSSHCMLVPYWAHRLGKRTLHARQVSARGGELFCEDLGERVIIAGHAAPYLEGTIEVPE